MFVSPVCVCAVLICGDRASQTLSLVESCTWISVVCPSPAAYTSKYCPAQRTQKNSDTGRYVKQNSLETRDSDKVVYDVKMEDVSPKDEVQERKMSNEEYIRSGFAKHDGDVDRISEVFDKVVWPALERQGWTKKMTMQGKMLFLPGGVKPSTGTLGTDYYDRIKPVLERLNERRNEAESSVADAFRREMSRPVKPTTPQSTSIRRRRNPSRSDHKSASGRSPSLDLSWKAGKSYPKKHSNVGPKYQVSFIPEAGTYEDASNEKSDAYCDLVWDPKEAEAKGIDIDSLFGGVNYNLKEAAFLLLKEKNYDVEEFKKALKELKPTDGSDWGIEKRKAFTCEIFRSRKDMEYVSEKMDAPIKTCLAYYYGSFKASEDYRLLKTVCCEERVSRLEELEHGVDACTICGDGGNLLICDGCEKEYHMGCVKPPLAKVPEGDWECDECVDTKFLMARDFLLGETQLFVKQESHKRKLDEMQDTSAPADEEGESEKTLLLPNAKVLEAARKFAKAVSIALSEPLPPKQAPVAATLPEETVIS